MFPPKTTDINLPGANPTTSEFWIYHYNRLKFYVGILNQ
jgi:hypothetical protein